MTTENLGIAVIIPLYNGAAFIEQALQSVLRQTLPAAEIIVVDDGSTDDGPAIVERITAAHPVRLLRQANGGQSSARNLGITRSTAPLIALLDQDDVWYGDHLEVLARPFSQARPVELGWTYSNLDEIDREGGLVARDVIDLTGSRHPKRNLQHCLASDMFVLPTATILSRAAFMAVGGFDERLSGYEDDDLFLRLFRAGYDNVYIPTALGQWRMYSQSASFSWRMALSRMIYMRKLVGSFPNDPTRELFYVRDLIAPRFLPWLVREYRLALQVGDSERIRIALTDLRYAGGLSRFPVRMVMAMLLPVLRLHWLTRRLLPLQNMLRPVARRILR